MPSHCDALKRHKFCNSCQKYLGLWGANPEVSECIVCQSLNVNGMFLEYSVRAQLIDAFQVRRLGELIADYREKINNRDES